MCSALSVISGAVKKTALPFSFLRAQLTPNGHQAPQSNTTFHRLQGNSKSVATREFGLPLLGCFFAWKGG
ncbi:hypothetical protein SBV1_280004 [Verrucomicrobia bacterium]|nr:hypothetical protein SBV1_280004 [Verrucomicrobiota bacterium]